MTARNPINPTCGPARDDRSPHAPPVKRDAVGGDQFHEEPMTYEQAFRLVSAGLAKTEMQTAEGMLKAGFKPEDIARTVGAVQRGNAAEMQAMALSLATAEGRPQ